MEKEFNGWKNYNTWNVALWLGNEYILYCATSGYAKYVTPYLSLRRDLKEAFRFTATKDGTDLWSKDLDINALNVCIQEMVS